MSTTEQPNKIGPIFQIIADDLSLALQTLTLNEGDLVLDVGTSEGYSAISLASFGLTVTTGEPESDRSQYANRPWTENAKKMGVWEKISFTSFSAESMPFSECQFSAAVFFGVLHHIDESDRSASLQEAQRVISENGYVIIFEPTYETLSKVWQKDPEHPQAVNPELYRQPGFHLKKRLIGKLMDIYIYQKRSANNNL